MKKAVTILSIMPVFFRGIFIGVKGVILLYIMDIFIGIFYNIPMFFIVLIFGLFNGFLDALIVSIINTFEYKILSCIIGFFAVIAIFILSLKLNLPDILSDYFVYGEGGGGLEPGALSAFVYLSLIYFGISFFVGYPIALLYQTTKIKSQ